MNTCPRTLVLSVSEACPQLTQRPARLHNSWKAMLDGINIDQLTLWPEILKFEEN
jgi:hypothetical protein